MVKVHAKAVDIWLNEYEFSGISNSVSIELSQAVAEATAFGDSYQTFLQGKAKATVDYNGVLDMAYEGYTHTDIATFAEQLVSISHATMADGVKIWMARMHFATKPVMAPIGGAATLNFTLEGTDPLGDGIILERDSAMVATVTGTAYNKGTVSATQQVVGFLHVKSAGTGTLDCVIQSDDAEAFTTPTARLTFTQANAATAEYKAANGAITDTWWRAVCTIAGAAPSFDVLVGLAIISQ